MPAKKKYLTTSFHQRFAKLTAGVIGGYVVTSMLFLVLALWVDHAAVLLTLKFAGFVVWCALVIIPFLFKNGWKAWGIYLLVILFLSSVFYLAKSQFPELLPV